MRVRKAAGFLLGALLCLIVGVAHAHKNSDSYLTLIRPPTGNLLQAQWDISLRDLQHAIGLDLNGDGAITWAELRARQAAVIRYALSHLDLEAIARGDRLSCVNHPQGLLFDEHVDGGYAVLRFTVDCPMRPEQLALHYRLLFDLDPNHRGLVQVRAGPVVQALTVSADDSVVVVQLNSPQRLQRFLGFLTEGVWHIWKGYDHILFLLTLLFPAVVVYRDRHWQARGSLRDSLLDVLQVVTAFTLAHSFSLTLAVNNWLVLPSRWVEAGIALTVLLGALNNLYPVIRERRWLVAFSFGLIHGMGFASVLADLGLRGWNLALSLLGFNVGVEIGQLAIVAVFVPLAFALRETTFYRRRFMPWGAATIGGIATYWFAMRITAGALQ